MSKPGARDSRKEAREKLDREIQENIAKEHDEYKEHREDERGQGGYGTLEREIERDIAHPGRRTKHAEDEARGGIDQ